MAADRQAGPLVYIPRKVRGIDRFHIVLPRPIRWEERREDGHTAAFGWQHVQNDLFSAHRTAHAEKQEGDRQQYLCNGGFQGGVPLCPEGHAWEHGGEPVPTGNDASRSCLLTSECSSGVYEHVCSDFSRRETEGVLCFFFCQMIRTHRCLLSQRAPFTRVPASEMRCTFLSCPQGSTFFLLFLPEFHNSL